MSWVRVDDGYADHPKILKLTDAAFRLHTCSLCWANRRATDGFISKRDLPSLIALLDNYQGSPATLVRELEQAKIKPDGAGLWEAAEGGWKIHDFDDYQPSAKEIEADREAARNRMRNLAAKRKEARAAAQQAASAQAAAEQRLHPNFARSSPEIPCPVPARPGPSRPVLPEEYVSEDQETHVQVRTHVDLAGGSSPPPPSAQGSLLPAESAAPTAKPARRPKSYGELSATAKAWRAYAEAYEKRYRTQPAQNGQVMGQLTHLVKNVGAEVAPELARYYLTRSDAKYSYHQVGPLLHDYQKLLTAMETGRVVTETTARRNEQTESNPFLELARERAREEQGEPEYVESRREE